MIIDTSKAERIYIAVGFTDLRKSIDGLAAIVSERFQLDPFTNSLFLFCGRRADRIKAIMWMGDGFVLLYKRLEGEGRFQWPRNGDEARNISPKQLRWLMEGLSIDQPKALKEIRNISVSGGQ